MATFGITVPTPGVSDAQQEKDTTDHHSRHLRGSEVLFVESLVILSLSIAATSSVLVGIWGRRWHGRGQAPHPDERRRHRGIRRFLDLIVTILMGLELWQSVNWMTGTILSEQLYGNSQFGSAARSKVTRAEMEGRKVACKVIGGLTYALDISLYLWHTCLSYSLHAWVVQKVLLRKLYRRMLVLFVLTLVVSLAITSIPLAHHAFGGSPGVTCWISDIHMTNLPVLINKLIVLPICWLYVGFNYFHTLYHIRRQASSTAPAPVTQSYRSLRRRLLLFTLIFFLAWLLNTLWYIILTVRPDTLPRALPPVLVLGLIGKLYYLIGFLDALAYAYGAFSMGGITVNCGRTRGKIREWLMTVWTRRTRAGEEGGQEEEGEREREGGSDGRRRTETQNERTSSWFTLFPGRMLEWEESSEEFERCRYFGGEKALSWVSDADAGEKTAIGTSEDVEEEGMEELQNEEKFEGRLDVQKLERDVETRQGGNGPLFASGSSLASSRPGQAAESGKREDVTGMEREEGPECRIFATSLNCGPCMRVEEMGCLDEWIPTCGYDLYVLALQECRFLSQIRKAVYRHIGGSHAFFLFEQALGDSVLSHGKIALLIFGRRDHVQQGVLRLAETGGTGRVATGIDLLFSRFHNKGVVGVALQYYGTAIAFLVGHFASDSGGKKRWHRRDDDAWRTLHMMHLAGDVEEFDVHLQHDHVILLGDLNYRTLCPVGEIMSRLAASSEVEKAKRGWPAYSGHTWRDDAYNRFFNQAKHLREARGGGQAQKKAFDLQNRTWDGYESERGKEGGEEAGGAGREVVAGAIRGTSYPTIVRPERKARNDQEHWKWVYEVDELSLSRRAGVALSGFREGPLTFPPTFKFNPGRSVEDYTNVSDLRYAYYIDKRARKATGGSGESRPPSWTDRVLYHSLPGMEGMLELEAYDMCDAIVGSDHRPIVAAFRLSLVTSGKGKMKGGWLEGEHGGGSAGKKWWKRHFRKKEGRTEGYWDEKVKSWSRSSEGKGSERAADDFRGGRSSSLPILPPRVLPPSISLPVPPSLFNSLPFLAPTSSSSTSDTILLSVRLSHFNLDIFPPKKPLWSSLPLEPSSYPPLTPLPFPSIPFIRKGEHLAVLSELPQRDVEGCEGVEGTSSSEKRTRVGGMERMDLEMEEKEDDYEDKEGEGQTREGETREGMLPLSGKGDDDKDLETGLSRPSRHHPLPRLPRPLGYFRRTPASYATPSAYTPAVSATHFVRPPPFLPQGASSFTSSARKPSFPHLPLQNQEAASAHPPFPPASLRRVSMPSTTSSFTHFFSPSSFPSSETRIGSVVVLMPIPGQDPWAAHRRVVLLGNTVSTRTPPSLTPSTSLVAETSEELPPVSKRSSSAATRLPETAEEGGKKAARVWEEVPHAHRYEWSDVKKKGELRFEGLVSSAGGMHMAMKFLDSQGQDMGQGVACLRDVVSKRGRKQVTMELSMGGVRVGAMHMRVVVKSRWVEKGSVGSAVGKEEECERERRIKRSVCERRR